MKQLVFIHLFVLITLIAFGQNKPVDFKRVKKVSKSESYVKLFDRFMANDTTLSADDYVLIYYGQAYRKDYKPNARHDSVRALNMCLNKPVDSIDFRRVLWYTDLILKDFPFNIEQIFIKGIAYDKLGFKDSSNSWLYKYDKLIRAIISSGDGKTPGTAFVVVKITDEYAVLNALELKFTGQALVGEKKKMYDLMNVAQNVYGIDQLYFDINLFFGKW